MVNSRTQQCIVDYEQAHDQAWVNAKYNAGLREGKDCAVGFEVNWVLNVTKPPSPSVTTASESDNVQSDHYM